MTACGANVCLKRSPTLPGRREAGCLRYVQSQDNGEASLKAEQSLNQYDTHWIGGQGNVMPARLGMIAQTNTFVVRREWRQTLNKLPFECFWKVWNHINGRVATRWNSCSAWWDILEVNGQDTCPDTLDSTAVNACHQQVIFLSRWTECSLFLLQFFFLRPKRGAI